MIEHSKLDGADEEGNSAELAKSAELDRRIRLAMHDVTLPTGLADRLKLVARSAAQARAGALDGSRSLASGFPEHLVAQIKESARTSEHETCEPTVKLRTDTAECDQDATHPADIDSSFSGMGRRAALLACFAAALSGFAWLAHQWQQPAEKTWLVAECQAILSKWEEDNPANIEPVGTALSDLPESVRSQLARMNLLGTRDLEALGGRRTGQLLRFDAGDGRAIVLLRMPKLPAVRGLNSRFELLPTVSGAWSLAALTIDKETYVLAASCTQQQLLTYIRRAAVT